MKKVAITGGSGFVGTAIYKECLKRNYEIVLFDRTEPSYELPEKVKWVQCDVVDLELVSKVTLKENPDEIYLIAGVLGTSELNETPYKASKNNILGVCTFMELAVAGRLPPIFYVTKPNVWDNLYTFTKEASEKIIKYYMGEGIVQGVIHKWFNAYGEGQHTHPVRKAVPYFILCALHNLPIVIWGNGEQTVDMIYIDDIAYLAVEAMSKKKLTNQNVIEIGRGIEVTVNQLAKDILNLTKSNSKIIHKKMRSGETANTKLVANIEGINNYIYENYQFYKYEEGLKNTIEYYKSISKEQLDDFFNFYKL